MLQKKKHTHTSCQQCATVLSIKSHVKMSRKSGVVTAAREGDLIQLQCLLNNGASVDERGHYGLTALMWAARTGQNKILKILLDNNANVHLRSDSGYTAFTCAASNGKHQCVRTLLNYGARVHDRNNGRTALHLAGAQADVSCMEILIEKGADINERDDQGQVALHHVADHWQKDTNRVQCAKLLLQHGADVNIRDKNRETVLHYSAYWGHFELSKIFLEHGVQTDLENRYGKTALELADDGIRDELRASINEMPSLRRGIRPQNENFVFQNAVNNEKTERVKMQESHENIIKQMQLQIDNLQSRVSVLESCCGQPIRQTLHFSEEPEAKLGSDVAPPSANSYLSSSFPQRSGQFEGSRGSPPDYNFLDPNNQPVVSIGTVIVERVIQAQTPESIGASQQHVNNSHYPTAAPTMHESNSDSPLPFQERNVSKVVVEDSDTNQSLPFQESNESQIVARDSDKAVFTYEEPIEQTLNKISMYDDGFA